MAVFRPSPSAAAVVRLVAAAALVAGLLPAGGPRLAAPSPALAAGFVVTSAADPGDGTCDGTCTLRDAILGANALAGHDTITFSPAVTTPIVVASDLPFITQALTIDGSGETITLDGASLYRLLWSSAPLTLSTMTIQRGRAPNVGFGGGGAYFGSAGTLVSVNFISNTALGTGGGGAFFASTAVMSGSGFFSNTVINGPGGGAYVAGSATVADTDFMTNTTNFSGGGLYVFGNGSLTATTFISNSANADGGGLYVFGTAALTGTSFIRNRAAVDYNASGGGALLFGDASLHNTTFTDNTAILNGGGAMFWDLASISDSAFTGNAAGNGGGAYLSAGGGLTSTLFVSNTALSDGGGLYWAAFAGPAGSLSGVTFTGNTATAFSGGGAYLGRSTTIADGEFLDNTAGAAGGGLFGPGGVSLTLTLTVFDNNTALSGGGASLGAATVVGGSFVNNTATGGGGGGGAQFAGAAVMVDATFAGNTAAGNGGGARFGAGAALTDVDFSLNQTTGFGTSGGGAYFGGVAAMSETTFISNTAANGNGGGFVGPIITMTDTVIMGNQALCEAAQLQAGPQAVNVDLCGNGGGAYIYGYDPELSQADYQRLQVERNHAERNGGGLFASGITDNGLSISGVVFEDNSAGERGGAAYLDSTEIRFSQLGMIDNGAVDDGGGVYLDNSHLDMDNALWAINHVDNPNGAADIGMSFYGASLDAKHVTFVPRPTGFKLAVSVGTDLPDEDGQQTVAHLTNVIFHGYDVGVQGQSPTSTVVITGVLWSSVTTPWQVGNVSLSAEYTGPAGFVDEGGDYHLTSASFAIDKGVVTNLTIDYDGNPRSQGLAPDLGAYEYVQFGFSKIYLPYVARGQ